MSNYQANFIVELFMKKGLRTYKYKNSHLKPLEYQSNGHKGAVFAYRNKSNMINGRGVVLTSEESLVENDGNFTHWTPNVYRYGTYADKGRTITKGHSEKNLKQINCFYIDFDFEKGDSANLSSNEILLKSIDLGFMPTMILKTDNGYQAYFVLETPAYVTASSEFKVIKVAKMISENLRKYFSADLPGVDLLCNHFGIARMPRKDNIEFYEPSYTYRFDQWLNWSLKFADDNGKRKPQLTVLVGSKGKRQVDEPWFDLLLNSKKIQGAKGLMGRNNVFFTMALAYFSSGYSQETCEYNLFEFNERLTDPLEDKEILKLVHSAYSGKYQAASRDYIITLCHEWVSENLTNKDLFISQGWTKFKKARKDRKRSHLHEWKEDLMAYLSEKSYAYKPYLSMTKKELREELAIPERSLDKLLKSLKGTNEIFYTVKAGRGGGIQIASVKTLCMTLIRVKKEMKQVYYEQLSALFNPQAKEVRELFESILNTEQKAIQTHLDLTNTS